MTALAAISGQSASNDATNVTYRFQYTGSPGFRRVFIDVDRNASTGFAVAGVGADYLLENSGLHRHLGGGWNWQPVKTVTFSAVSGTAQWTVARADIGETATPNDASLVFQTEAPLTTTASYIHVYSGGVSAISTTNDATNVYYEFQYGGSPAYRRAYIDTDRNSATGFAVGGMGADYLLENASLHRHQGGGWNWQPVKTVTFSASASTARWTVARADIGETATPNSADVIFQTEAPVVAAPRQTHVYSGNVVVSFAQTSAAIVNPERGFYRHDNVDCDKHDFTVSELQSYRTVEGISLMMCIFYLEGFQGAPLSAAALSKLQAQAAAVRGAGLKMILRFAYTRSHAGDDAPLPRVLAHLDQLAPVLAANSDVIYAVPVGFVGAYGEGYYTQNFGNQGVVSPADWLNRKAIVDKLLAVLPSNRMVQLRTPLSKRTMYSPDALPAGEAYSGSARARIGHHNDCFLASPDDFGTYANTAVEYPYLSSETTYLPMGGETCVPNPPRSSCPTALAEMALFHWSYLNIDFEPAVIAAWDSGGCLDDIGDRLGYRFALQSATLPEAAHPGAGLPVTITVRNDGWAAPFNARPAALVLRNTTTGATHQLPLTADPRRWFAATTVTISQTVTVPPTLPAGSYALLLNLADPAPALAARPEYAIRLANQNVWEADTGLNRLLHTVTVR